MFQIHNANVRWNFRIFSKSKKKKKIATHSVPLLEIQNLIIKIHKIETFPEWNIQQSFLIRNWLINRDKTEPGLICLTLSLSVDPHGPLHLWNSSRVSRIRAQTSLEESNKYRRRMKVKCIYIYISCLKRWIVVRGLRSRLISGSRVCVCFRRTLIWWKPGAGRALPSSTRITKGWCVCRSYWRHTDPVNFLLRSGSSARDLNIGEFLSFFFFPDFYLLSVFLNASIRIMSKSRKDFINLYKVF